MVGIEKLDWAAASDKSANTLDYPIDGLTVKFLRVKAAEQWTVWQRPPDGGFGNELMESRVRRF